MGFLKNHYEKILLAVVLLGLAVAVVLLPMKIAADKEAMGQDIDSLLHQGGKALPPLDDARYTAIEQRVARPQNLNLSQPHNLFNPVPWQRRADGSLIKVQTGNEVGPNALQIVKLNPLYTTVALESVDASGTNYLVSIQRDAEAVPARRRKKSYSLEVGGKCEAFVLQQANVKPESPDKPELVLQLVDTGAKIIVTADRPFQRVDGHSADLRYDPEKRVWQLRRVNDTVSFAGDVFQLQAIIPAGTNQFEVVVSARSTGKKTTIKYNADAQP